MPRDYSLALMEYIAHLSVGDWNALADDLVNLGFVDDISDRERLVRGGWHRQRRAARQMPAGQR